MSIPPLVCCTPPPLEQCEDDKDAEDFDLQYNLSPYDDDEGNDYNYQNFDTYNDIKPTSSAKTTAIEFLSPDVKVVAENVKNKDVFNESENVIDKYKSRLNTEEEVNIEDLNLKLVREEPPEVKDVINGDGREDECNVNSKVDQDTPSIPESLHDTEVRVSTEARPIVEEIDEVSSKPDIQDLGRIVPDTFSNEINQNQTDDSNKQDNDNVTNESKREDLDTPNVIKNDEDNDDDFDDFQFINSNNMPVNNTVEVSIDQESPWGNEETMHSDFGNFTANFENNAIQFQQDESNAVDDNKDKSITISEEDDDDFGDFDDFKTSAANTKSNDNNLQELPQQVPVLNIQSSSENENQVIESINKILTSIFKEEAAESEEILEAKLDAVLNETWGHLMETDVRQPYIVNWNNSLAQKTLLKALCIDSRNILFGPKWSYNMPKYAANLTAAPLQPLKQPSTTIVAQNETTNPDKATPKPTTWTDPFATNGQESCSNEGENAVIEPRPTDLDVFEAAMSSKKDKIYSSTISVQPIRQINLPDTHIFTPTDSETPRSKTIHYDCGPSQSVLMSQPVIDSFNIDETKPVTSSVPNTISNNTGDNEYWEFQDFKGTTVESNGPSLVNNDTSNTLSKLNVTYQTQMLQPIKLEPIIPTLNWPDPGEIKETFEDFSDFMTNSSSSSKVVIPEEPEDNPTNEITEQTRSIEKDIKGTSLKSNDSFDDEFDTFQSALPPPNQNTTFEFNLSAVENKLESIKVKEQTSPPHVNNAELDCVFPNNTYIKSDDISFTNFTKPFEALSQPVDNTNLKVQPSLRINLTNSSILQPIPSGVVGQVPTTSSVILQNQQKSGQILQPLSLESYSQINWPNPGIDLQDLSRFNPVETLPSLKSDTSGSSHSRVGTPNHSQKTVVNNQTSDEDIWGEFVSSNPKQPPPIPKMAPALIDDDEWTDFVSSSSVKPPNGLNTISFNVHTNSNMQKSNQNFIKKNQIPLDIPTLNYITPKTGNHKSYNDKHFQNL